VNKTLNQLKREVESRDLPVTGTGRQGKILKRDYITALQKYFLPEEVSFGLNWRLKYQSPQLCYLYSNLTEEQYNNLFEDPNYIFEEKYNGVRMMLFYHPKTGIELYSRNISEEDYLPISYTDKVLLTKVDTRLSGLFPKSFILDCEVMSRDARVSTIMENRGVETETVLQAVAALLALNKDDTLKIQSDLSIPLYFRAFDCLMFDGEDLVEKEYLSRRKYVKYISKWFYNSGIALDAARAVKDRKKDFLKMIFKSGGEGVVAKPLDMKYTATESRTKKGWIKIKRSVSAALKDSVDGFVTGFVPGNSDRGFSHLVGALEVSIFVEDDNGDVEEKIIAQPANMSMEMRERISIKDENGDVAMIPEMYGQVVEVEGQSVSAREHRLVHPRLIRMRDDKDKFSCTIKKEDLLSLIM
jgi:ATP-dependent DNA ligase